MVHALVAEDFKPYIARNRRMAGFTFDMWITDPVAEEWYGGKSSHDLPECVWLFSHIRAGMRVADCGAHHGFLTIPLSKAVGPTGVVGAWEALPRNAAVINENLALNGCHNVFVHPLALGDERKMVRFWTHTSNSLVPWQSPEYGNDEVQMVRLDDEIPAHVKIDLIKIDVEGSDLQMVRGARRVLSERPIIDLELHCCLFEHRNDVIAEIFSLLEPLGYAYSVLARGDDVVRSTGWNINLMELAQYDNPHVFCLPVW
jgi:FkbM family methyltransferase